MSEQDEQFAVASRTVRPMLTLTEAAVACGVSRATLRRSLDAGAFPDAEQDDSPNRVWRISVNSLLDAGYRVNAPVSALRPFAEQSDDTGDTSSHEQGEQVAELRVRLAEADGRAERWQAVAEERAQALQRADIALRMLNAGTSAEGDTLMPVPARVPRSWIAFRWIGATGLLLIVGVVTLLALLPRHA